MFTCSGIIDALTPWKAVEDAFDNLCYKVDKECILLHSTTVIQTKEQFRFKVTFKFDLLCKD